MDMESLCTMCMSVKWCVHLKAGVLCAALRCAVLCCAVLCCAVLCCAVLCCAVLCCAVLCCAVLCCAVLCCAVLCCAVLCCATYSHPQGNNTCCIADTCFPDLGVLQTQQTSYMVNMAMHSSLRKPALIACCNPQMLLLLWMTYQQRMWMTLRFVCVFSEVNNTSLSQVCAKGR